MENAVADRGHTYPVWALDISQQGQYFASGSQDRTAKLWMFDRTYPLRILAGHTADVDVNSCLFSKAELIPVGSSFMESSNTFSF